MRPDNKYCHKKRYKLNIVSDRSFKAADTWTAERLRDRTGRQRYSKVISKGIRKTGIETD